MKYIKYILLFFAVCGFLSADAARLNDKVLNRPYADMRKWHLGFSVGTHTQDLSFSHNGFVTENGETWFMEQPAFSPGFNVTGLAEVRLNNYFSVRFSPGMYFGNKVVKMYDTTNKVEEQQNVKTSYVVLPFDVKFAGQRYRNARPYVVGGAMATFDVAKKRSDFLKLKTTDLYLTLGFGCDFYLPYFKLIPEVKFCIGLTDVLDRNREFPEPTDIKYTNSIKKMVSSMIILSFYFE